MTQIPQGWPKLATLGFPHQLQEGKYPEKEKAPHSMSQSKEHHLPPAGTAPRAKPMGAEERQEKRWSLCPPHVLIQHTC